jgi:hypothetical protein
MDRGQGKEIEESKRLCWFTRACQMPISGTDGSLDPIDLPIIARKGTSFRRDNAQSARFAYPKTGPIQLMRPCHCVTWHGLASILPVNCPHRGTGMRARAYGLEETGGDWGSVRVTAR